MGLGGLLIKNKNGRCIAESVGDVKVEENEEDRIGFGASAQRK